jgi:hypothetical protein
MSEITVGELIEQLKIFNKDDPVCFGPNGYFSFYRTKDRGGVVQVEFNEAPGVEYSLLPEHPNYSKF